MNEGVVPERWGSHWRWRVAMLVVVASILAYASWQAGRWKYRAVVESGGSPVVYRVVHHDGSTSLEAFDWKTGKCWTISENERDFSSGAMERSIRVVRDGELVLWRNGRHICMANVHSPHERRNCDIPFGRPEFQLLGFSQDGVFAVFQVVEERYRSGGQDVVHLRDKWPSMNAGVGILHVVDLQSGRVVSTREWNSVMVASTEEGEFESSRMTGEQSEPGKGRWKLSAEGQWQLIEDWTRSPRWMSRWPQKPAAVVPPTALFPIGATAITGELLLEEESLQVISDVCDDITVFDPTSGRIIATETSGSQRRIHLLAAGAAILICCALWMRIVLAEADVRWGLFDAVGATLLIQAAIFPFEASIDLLYRWPPTGPDFQEIVPAFLLRGGLAGAAILVGWYWAPGRERFALRWLVGNLWLVAYAVPLVAYGWNGYYVHPFFSLRGFVIVGLLLSAVVAGVTVLCRLLGWSIHEPRESPTVWRFALVELLALMAAVGTAMLLVETLSGTLNSAPILGLSTWSPAAFLAGIPLVGLLFVRSGWTLAGGVLSIGIALLWAGATIYNFGTVLPIDPLERCIGEGAALVGSTVTIVAPCLVLRKHGWGWVQTKSNESLVG